MKTERQRELRRVPILLCGLKLEVCKAYPPDPSWSCINAACAALLSQQLVRLAQWIARNVEASLWWWSCSHEKARNLQQSNSYLQAYHPAMVGKLPQRCIGLEQTGSWGTNRSFSFAMPCLLARSCEILRDLARTSGIRWPLCPVEVLGLVSPWSSEGLFCFSPPVQPLKAEKEKRSMIYWRKGMQGLVEPWYLVLAASRC